MKKRTRDDKGVLALKLLCAVQGKHRYIAAALLVDRNESAVIRSAAVVSHNPAVCEIDVADDWDAVERAIHRYKLEPGADFTATKDLLLRMHQDETKLASARDAQEAEAVFRDTVAAVLRIEDAGSGAVRCSADLAPLGGTRTEDSAHCAAQDQGFSRTIDRIHENAFFIRVRPVLDERRGIPPHRLKHRCMLECVLTDKREVVQYIIGLLYGNGQTTIRGRVIETEDKQNGYTQITLAITPVIFARLVLHKSQRVRTA